MSCGSGRAVHRDGQRQRYRPPWADVLLPYMTWRTHLRKAYDKSLTYAIGQERKITREEISFEDDERCRGVLIGEKWG